MICFKCSKEIGEEKLKIVALDRPYINLVFHEDPCYNQIKNNPDEYVNQEKERVFELASHSNKSESKTKRK